MAKKRTSLLTTDELRERMGFPPQSVEFHDPQKEIADLRYILAFLVDAVGGSVEIKREGFEETRHKDWQLHVDNDRTRGTIRITVSRRDPEASSEIKPWGIEDECASCRAKPGSPELCADCLRRRTERNGLVKRTRER